MFLYLVKITSSLITPISCAVPGYAEYMYQVVSFHLLMFVQVITNNSIIHTNSVLDLDSVNLKCYNIQAISIYEVSLKYILNSCLAKATFKFLLDAEA